MGAYIQADISGNYDGVVALVQEFVSSNPEGTLHECVSYVEANLPSGVDRVDGYCIEPIMRSVTYGSNE